MMKCNSLMLILLALFTLAACEVAEKDAVKGVEGADPVDGVEAVTKEETVQEIIDQAQTVYQSAKDHDHAWTITTQLLTSARDKLATGDATAMADAQRALFTARASLTQATKEMSAWKYRVPQ